MTRHTKTEPMVQRNFGLRYSQYLQLKTLSDSAQMDMAEIVRNALDAYFKKHGVQRAA